MKIDPRDLPAGTVVGGHRLEALLGAGAFGAVFRSTRVATGAAVALKIVDPGTLEPTGGEARFRREAELAQRLRHPGSLRVLEVGRDASGLLYMALEILEGRTLEDVIRATGRVALARVAKVGVEILAALEEAHGIGLVHRDIKPANVFLVRDGAGERAKLIDFGLAKSTNVGTAAGLTREGTAVGTPLYMAPEQIVAEAVTARTDLFSLGVTLAEAAHGGPLYEDTTVMKLLTDRISGVPVPVPREIAATPLEPILRRATSLKAEDRFATAGEMRAALEAIAPLLDGGAGDAATGPTAIPPEAAAPTAVPADVIARTALAATPPALLALPAARARSRVGFVIGAVAAIGVVAGVVTTVALLSARGDAAPSTASASANASVRLDASGVSITAPKYSLLDDGTPLEKVCRVDLAGKAILRIQVLASKAMIEALAPGEEIADIYFFQNGVLANQGKSTLKKGTPAIDLAKVRFSDFPRMRGKTSAASGVKDTGPITIDATSVAVTAGDHALGRFDLEGKKFRLERE